MNENALRSPWIIYLKRERFKFSSAHMTIFPDGSKERLHGHNYNLAVKIHLEKADFNNTINFSIFKNILTNICETLDERVLIAQNNNFCSIKMTPSNLLIKIFDCEYSLPKEDVCLLPLDNISVEQLSAHISRLYLDKIKEFEKLNAIISAIEIEVDEAVGQSASYYLANLK